MKYIIKTIKSIINPLVYLEGCFDEEELGDDEGPYIIDTTITNDNSIITVIFNEDVYGGPEGTPEAFTSLQVNDFSITISDGDGSVTVVETPTKIEQSKTTGGWSGLQVTNTKTVKLWVTLNGIPSGFETLTVLPSSHTTIWDGEGNNATSDDWSTNYLCKNTVMLNAQTAH